MHAAGEDVFDQTFKAGNVKRIAVAQWRDHGRNDAVIFWYIHWESFGSRGRISSTINTESNATPANAPKMMFSGTWRSRSAPKAQSPKPPQLMLTKFMMP